MWKSLTVRRNGGVNVSVNRSKGREKERRGERYLSEERTAGRGGGVLGAALVEMSNAQLLSGDQFFHYSLLLPLPSLHGISARS